MIQYEPIQFIEEEQNNALKMKIYNQSKIISCPFCNSSHYIKYGFFKGIQRYRCKECRKTFSNGTNSLYSYSKKHISKWSLFFKYMMEKKTLRFSAEKVGISVSTAFTWRHKIMDSLEKKTVSDKLEGKVFLADSFIKDNYKGCRNLNELPLGRRGYVTIAAAYGRCDSWIIAPISRVIYLDRPFVERIYSKISKDAYIVPNNSLISKGFADAHNKWVALHDRVEKRTKTFGVDFRRWIGEFNGVATKYLQRYMYYYSMFILFRKFTDKDILSLLNEKIKFKHLEYKFDLNDMDYMFKV